MTPTGLPCCKSATWRRALSKVLQDLQSQQFVEPQSVLNEFGPGCGREIVERHEMAAMHWIPTHRNICTKEPLPLTMDRARMHLEIALVYAQEVRGLGHLSKVATVRAASSVDSAEFKQFGFCGKSAPCLQFLLTLAPCGRLLPSFISQYFLLLAALPILDKLNEQGII